MAWNQQLEKDAWEIQALQSNKQIDQKHHHFVKMLANIKRKTQDVSSKCVKGFSELYE